MAAAQYQLGELHRLRGNFGAAEKAYREASRSGRGSLPGLALLRLAQGQMDAAAAGIRRALAEPIERRQRARMLAAGVEVLIAASDVPGARAAADALTSIAEQVDAPLVCAMSAGATGAVRLAENDPRAALIALRRAWTLWRDLEAPYEAARVRVLVALVCRALGDGDSMEMELDAARQVFEELGAEPDIQRLAALARPVPGAETEGLTPREAQVLALIATGRTNRAIADTLVISEKTVARHVSNIFAKLGLANRAAATAYAFQHDLLEKRAR
jgi:DNA-binding CsgD family transcriptional regulator